MDKCLDDEGNVTLDHSIVILIEQSCVYNLYTLWSDGIIKINFNQMTLKVILKQTT